MTAILLHHLSHDNCGTDFPLRVIVGVIDIFIEKKRKQSVSVPAKPFAEPSQRRGRNGAPGPDYRACPEASRSATPTKCRRHRPHDSDVLHRSMDAAVSSRTLSICAVSRNPLSSRHRALISSTAHRTAAGPGAGSLSTSFLVRPGLIYFSNARTGMP